MEDNNNLEDFFRKRLSSIDDSDASWFNPDPMTDQLILNQLTASKKSKRSKMISSVLLALLFLLLLGYIAHLKYAIHHLSSSKTPTAFNQNIQQSNSSINNIDSINTHQNQNQDHKPNTNNQLTNQTVTTSDKSVSNLVNSVKTNKVATLTSKQKQLVSNNKVLQAKNQALAALVQEQNETIQALKEELANNDCYQQNTGANGSPLFAEGNKNQTNSTGNTLLDNNQPNTSNNNTASNQANANRAADSMAIADANENDQGTELATEELASFNDLESLQPSLFSINTEPETVESDVPFLIKKKRRMHSLEFGMEVSLHGLVTPIDRSIKNQRLAVANEHTATLIMPMHGINLAYSPVKNFWIRTGARIGVNNSTIQHKLGVVYDDTDQYQLNSGAKGHDFILNTNTDYTESIDELKLTIPQNTTNGDLFELEYFETYDLVRVQVPLTFEYYFGSKKFQPMIHLGFQWNMLNYLHQVSSIDIVSRDQSIDFSTAPNLPEKKATNVHFMGFSTGAGLNWNLRPHFALRAQFAYETNFMVEAFEGPENSTNSGFACKFGLYFKF